MPRRRAVRRRYTQARRMRRYESERPSVGVIVRQSTAWAALNIQRLPGLVLILGSLLVIGCLFGDTRFYVYGAEVTGNRLVPAQAIYEASNVDAHSVFFVSTDRVRQRLLAAFPTLSDARVAVDLPARLTIQVAEPAVQMAWEVGGQTYLTDEQGHVMGNGAAPAEAVRVHCSDDTQALDGQIGDRAVIETVLQLSQHLGCREFEYTPHLGVAWRTPAGWPVYFGVGGDLAQKVSVMRTMVQELEAKGIQPQFLNVAVPTRPYYQK